MTTWPAWRASPSRALPLKLPGDVSGPDFVIHSGPAAVITCSPALLLRVIARDGVKSLFRFPADVGICRAVLAAREGADDAECRGIEVVVRVLAVGRERETEAHDERPVDAGLVEQLELVDEEPGLGLFIPGYTGGTPSVPAVG
jgi:hypothetical protein